MTGSRMAVPLAEPETTLRKEHCLTKLVLIMADRMVLIGVV